ncbi:hypothetical protein D0469_02490 [Peribacillus saganii]|uniref:DUF1468 domain-containing protein n=1 Tax=Peribacillus saganii TaxID=2303992 RepID=A0A372LSP7_9BACI|nr:tripartite tricarboxylate transporter TctB family protein [Peribacillus saganii]RFU71208.1 hypothetical protein D0469_02490 [Peribacillus saganii]
MYFSQVLKKLLFPVIGIVFTSAFFVNIRNMDSGASSYPKGIIAVLSLLFIWTLSAEIKNLLASKKESGSETNSLVSIKQLIIEWKKPLLTLLILFIYAKLISIIGFYVSTIFFLLAIFSTLGIKDLKTLLFNLLLLIALSYTLFDYILQIQLPKGIFF